MPTLVIREREPDSWTRRGRNAIKPLIGYLLVLIVLQVTSQARNSTQRAVFMSARVVGLISVSINGSEAAKCIDSNCVVELPPGELHISIQTNNLQTIATLKSDGTSVALGNSNFRAALDKTVTLVNGGSLYVQVVR
jgi:hypothetical protein